MHEFDDPILNEEEVANWIDTSRPTLQRQRSDGSGPPFIQLSERRIGYRKSAIERWLEARTINRVGELVSSPEAPKPAARPSTSVPATSDGANAGTKVKPPSTQKRGGPGHE